MRDLIVRLMVPSVATTTLLGLLSLLTWLGWRSKRGSVLHSMRLWVLTALVAISGGTLAGCGDQSNGPEPNTGTDGAASGDGTEPMPTCYRPVRPPDQNANPDQQNPPQQVIMPTCYAPMDPGAHPGSGGPQPSGEATPDAGTPSTPPPPARMCYAPRRVRPDPSGKS